MNSDFDNNPKKRNSKRNVEDSDLENTPKRNRSANDHSELERTPKRKRKWLSIEKKLEIIRQQWPRKGVQRVQLHP